MAVELITKVTRSGKTTSAWVAVPVGATGLSVELDSTLYSDLSQEVKFHVWGRNGGGDPVYLGGGGYHGGLTQERANKVTRIVETRPHGPRRLNIDYQDQAGRPKQIPYEEVMAELEVLADTLVCGATILFRPEA